MAQARNCDRRARAASAAASAVARGRRRGGVRRRGEPRLERGDPRLERLLRQARLGRHRLHRVEFLAPHQVHPARARARAARECGSRPRCACRVSVPSAPVATRARSSNRRFSVAIAGAPCAAPAPIIANAPAINESPRVRRLVSRRGLAPITPAMIVITGGAGFIGSNLAAALEERGERDLVVCDRLGSDDKWRNLAKRELAAIVPPEGLMAFLAAHAREIDSGLPSGRRSRPPPRATPISSSPRISPCRWRCGTGARRPRRGSSMPPRRRPMATAAPASTTIPARGAGAAAAAQCLWLVEASLRPPRRAAGRSGAPRAAAMGGAQVLQRLSARTNTTRAR